MSQAYEDSIQLFCVRCEDVGLYCNCTICGISEERVIDNTIMHMFEYYAIEGRRESMRTPLSPT
jgi:predicted small metal-binding protein